MLSRSLCRQPKRSMAAARSGPRTCIIWSRPNLSWPAGTGVWVVKTHCCLTASASASVAALRGAGSDAGFEQADGEKSGVALVHVADFGLHAEGVQEVNAAEAEDGLLAEAIVGVAAVEVVGEAAVPGVVAVDVGVEQEDGDDVAGDADDVEAPGAEGDLAALHGDGDGLVGGGERRLGRPDNVALGLLAGGVEVLLEVAAAMHERDGDQGNAGIGGGAEGVAGQHAEAAGVGGQGLGEGDLHGEVGDLARGDVKGGRLLGAGAGS